MNISIGEYYMIISLMWLAGFLIGINIANTMRKK